MRLSTSWGTGRPASPAVPESTSWGTGRHGRLTRRAAALVGIAVVGSVLVAAPAHAATSRAAATTAASAASAATAVHADGFWGPTTSTKGWSAASAESSNVLRGGGAGQTVAVLDSGVTPVPALAGRVVQGADFTGQGFTDGYGHGTFVAGLIAGNGLDSNGRQTGIQGTAPNATIVSVKVVRNDGTSNELMLAQGLVWLLQHHAQYGIGVVNISLGVGAVDADPASDPIDTLVEALWHSGVVVVVSAGNDATAVRSAPADDPTVLTVGATYADGNLLAFDDQAAPFSDNGSTQRGVTKPEVSVAGVHLQSTLPATSALAAEQTTPGLPSGYGQMSGTSMAAGVLSGMAAELLAMHRGATPAQVKAMLVRSAQGPARSVSTGLAALQLPLFASDPPPAPALGSLLTALSSAAGIAPITDWATATFTDVVWSTVVWSHVVWSTVVWSSDVWSTVVWSTRDASS